MKLALIIGFVALMMACTTTTIITVTPTPTEIPVVATATPTESPPTESPTSDISGLEQSWIENWTEDGSSETEAACIWDLMVDYFGGEAGFMTALIVNDNMNKLASEFMLDDPAATFDCFEYD